MELIEKSGKIEMVPNDKAGLQNLYAPQVPILVPTKSDADIAAELKKEAEASLLAVCDVLDRANRAGFVISFAIGVIPGRNVLQNLTVAKHY